MNQMAKTGEIASAPAAGTKRILVIDVGGNNVKFRVSGDEKKRKFSSGPDMTPEIMVDRILEMTADDEFDFISIGCPGPVRDNKVIMEPVNLGKGWIDFDFEAAFGKPTRIVNDAVMQAIGSYEGGTVLFLGLGTGLGAALIVEGTPVPLEVAHMPYKNGKTFEDYVGKRGLERLGEQKWSRAVFDVMEILRKGLVADTIVVGGGNAKKLKELPDYAIQGSNKFALIGGERLWD